MILEYAQLLSTAHRVLDGEPIEVPYVPIKFVDGTIKIGKPKTRIDMVLEDREMEHSLYRQTHQNHPSAIWARGNSLQYSWLYYLLRNLLQEYTYRYGKVHKTAALMPYLAKIPKNIKKDLAWRAPTPAMDDEYIVAGNSLASYHAYYNGAKRDMFGWKKREVPPFVMG